jgi:hypothetical protein
VPVSWKPWPHQLGFWNARFREGKKRFVEVWHRRAGKDITAENMCTVEMFKRPGTYWHVFPTYAQARKAIWQGSTNDGRKFLSYIPKQSVKRMRNDEMLVVVDVGGVSGTFALDLAVGNFFVLSVTGDLTLTLTNAPPVGQLGRFTVEMSMGSEFFDVTWPTSFRWAFDLGPLAPEVNSVLTVSGYTVTGGSEWLLRIPDFL